MDRSNRFNDRKFLTVEKNSEKPELLVDSHSDGGDSDVGAAKYCRDSNKKVLRATNNVPRLHSRRPGT